MSGFAWKSRVVWWGIMAALAAALAAGAFIAVQYATAADLGEVQPPDGAVLRVSEVVVSASLPGFEPGSAQVEMLVDAEPVPPEHLEVVPGAVRAVVSLRDGAHWVRVTLSSGVLISRTKVDRWSFVVDTTPPSVTVTNPASAVAFSTASARLDLAFREPVRVQLRVDGEDVPVEVAPQTPLDAAAEAPAQATALEARADLHLTPGQHSFAVTATDRAGNTTTKTWRAWVDFQSPEVEPLDWPGESWDEPRRELVLLAVDDQPDGLDASVQVDGIPVQTLRSPSPGRQDVRLFVIDTGELAEGEHVLKYRVADRVGNAQEGSYDFLVDSTETFGERPSGIGAKGRDISTLQKVLREKGFLDREPTGIFDEATAKAVVGFNVSHGLSAKPALDAEGLAKLLGSIVIDRSERRLYLYDGDTLLKTYSVAVGQPRYPTPTGAYRIVNKAYNPTWNPPPSPWADGLEPVPPGPDNPLGTRWMGLSAPHVGIHGTYQGWSIGTAASHGCIRMHIRDVEDLFERVFVGTPVEIIP